MRDLIVPALTKYVSHVVYGIVCDRRTMDMPPNKEERGTCIRLCALHGSLWWDQRRGFEAVVNLIIYVSLL